MPVSLPMLQTLGADAFGVIARDHFANVSYAQHGEDIIIQELFDNYIKLDRPGRFIDFGAYDSRRFSNTFLLSLRGWTGINIDANPDNIAKLNQERPRDRNICAGVGPRDETQTFFRFVDAPLSTFSAGKAAELVAGGWPLRDRIEVPVRCLGPFLEELSSPGGAPDFMNVDIEEMDESAILTVGFDRVRPTVLAIELNRLDGLAPAQNRVVQHLTERGYRLMAFCLATAIFLDGRAVSGV